MSRLVPSEYQFPSNDSLLFKTRNVLFTHQVNANIISLHNYSFYLITQQKALNRILALVSFAKPMKMAIITQINGNTSVYTVRDKAEPHHMKLQHQNLKSIAFNATDDFLQISYISGSDIYMETLSYYSLKLIDLREMGQFDAPIDKQLITEFATYIVSQKKVYKFTNRGLDLIGSGEDVFEGEDQRIYVYYHGSILVEADARRSDHLEQVSFDDWISLSKFYASSGRTQLLSFTELYLMPTCQNYNFEQYANYLVLNNTDYADYAAVFDFRTGQLLTTIQIYKGYFYSVAGELLVTEMSQYYIKKVAFGKFSAEMQAQQIDVLRQQKFQNNANYYPLQQLVWFFGKQEKLAFNAILEAQGAMNLYSSTDQQSGDKLNTEIKLGNAIAALITPNGKIYTNQVIVNFADVVYELNLACERVFKMVSYQFADYNLSFLAGIICKLALSTAYYLLVYRNPYILYKYVVQVPLLSKSLRVTENFDFDVAELVRLGNQAIYLFYQGKTAKSAYSRDLVLSLIQAFKVIDTKCMSRFADKTFLQLIAGMDYESELVGVKRIYAKRQGADVYDAANVLSYIYNLADRNTKKDKIIEAEFQQLMRTLWGDNRSKMDAFKESIFRCDKAYLFRDIIGQETAYYLFATYPEIYAYCYFAGAHSVCAYKYRELGGLTSYNAKIASTFLGILHEKFFNIQSLHSRFGDLSEQQIALVADVYEKIEDFYYFYYKFHQMNIYLIKRYIMRGYEIIETQRPFLNEKEYMLVKVYEQNAEVELRGHTMIYDDANIERAEYQESALANMKINTEFISQEASYYSEGSKRSEAKSQKGHINKLDRIAYAGKMNVVLNQGLASLRDEFDVLAQKKHYKVYNEHLDIVTFVLANMQTNSSFYREIVSILCAEQVSDNFVFEELKVLLLSVVGNIDRVEDVLINVFECLKCDFSTFFQLLMIACFKMCNFCMIHDVVEDIQGFGNLKQVVIRVIDKIMRLSVTFDWVWKVW